MGFQRREVEWKASWGALRFRKWQISPAGRRIPWGSATPTFAIEFARAWV
jgi:hypothetical protein